MANNLVLVIGGTGAQGAAVVEELIKDKKYTVRILTRDANSRRAKELAAKGNVELFQGSVTNEDDLIKAFKGVSLAFVNLDTFTMGEKSEVFWGIRIFELAQQAGTVRHYVWGGLEYIAQQENFNPRYKVAHYDAKGRITQFMRGQPAGSKMIWSTLASGPYMDMLFESLGPEQEADGTFVFTSPIGNGAMGMIALDDLGYYARWLFEHPEKAAGLELKIATQDVTWRDIVQTFTEVTGKPAKHVDLTVEEYMAATPEELKVGPPDGMTWKQNFTNWWYLYRDRLIKKDYNFLYSIHPQHLTLKTWMIKHNYNGTKKQVLKDVEDGRAAKPNS